MLRETFFESVLPAIPVYGAKPYLKALHTLILNRYFILVSNIFEQCSLPKFLIYETFDESYHKWKYSYKHAARYFNWYTVCCQPNCHCEKCTKFRSERLSQFAECQYNVPCIEPLISPMARMRISREKTHPETQNYIPRGRPG